MLLKRPPPGSAGSKSQPDARRVWQPLASASIGYRVPVLDPERRAQTATRFRVWGEISDSVRVPSESLGWDWVGCALGSERWVVTYRLIHHHPLLLLQLSSFYSIHPSPFAQPLTTTTTHSFSVPSSYLIKTST